MKIKMNKLLLLLIGSCFIFVSCDNKGQKKEKIYGWGESEIYSDFLWKKYKPDTLYKTMIVESDDFSEPVKLGLYKLDDDYNYISVSDNDEVELFSNGIKCKDNIITIMPGDKEFELGLVFVKSAEEGKHEWVLKLLDAGDIEILNGGLTSSEDFLIFKWEAKKVDKMNPLAFLFLCVFLVILSLLVFWFLMLRPIFVEHFKIRDIMMENIDVQKKYRVKGVLSITFSNRIIKQGLLERIFIGKRLFVNDSFFINGEVVMVPGKRGVRIRGVQNYSITQTLITKDDIEPTILSNELKQKYEIRVV